MTNLDIHRQTVKFSIEPEQVEEFRSFLKSLMVPDKHSVEGSYRVRSIYFDDRNLEALMSWEASKPRQKKFRIRFYNNDPAFIRFEGKRKIDTENIKIGTEISKEEVERIIEEDFDFLRESESPVLLDFLEDLMQKELRPVVIIDYTREAYEDPETDIRLTLDHDIKASLNLKEFLNPDLELNDHIGEKWIIEVKGSGIEFENFVKLLKDFNLEEIYFSKYFSTKDLLVSSGKQAD